MGVSPRVGAGFPTREGYSGFVGSMTNMDRVLSPGLTVKRYCMSQRSAKRTASTRCESHIFRYHYGVLGKSNGIANSLAAR